jgi:uncharacterized protein with GYD domain
MIQFSYTKEAAAAMVRKPEDRSKAIGALAEEMGGRVLDFYFAFGDYDGVLIADLPDNTVALATVMAAVSPGHVAAIKTTVLLTPAEAVAAMEKAAGVSYKGPGT